MRSSTRIVLWAGSCAALAGTALAADLTGPEIKSAPLRQDGLFGDDLSIGKWEGRPGRDLLG
jgi:hypothetical protein